MEYAFDLPNGYIDPKGCVHKRVALKALGGYEEELLSSSPQSSSANISANLISKLLSRCLCKVGNIDSVDENIAKRLLIEDRLFLLLKLRLITFGDFIQAVIHCPSEACNKKIDIDFNISDIQFESKENTQEYYQFQLSEKTALQCGVEDPSVVFRLPNGGDQEVVSGLMISKPAEALSVLLSRCIKTFAGSENITLDQIRSLPVLARLEIERAIEERAGDTDLNMTTHCPHCQLEFEVPFDIQDFFFGELKISQERLYQEVHYLAFHYHWSEQEIMSMNKDKRRHYIDLLSEEIERLNDAAA